MEKVKSALVGVPGLTAADAAMMCRHSLGILARGLSREQAQQIQAQLAAQGIETGIADQAALPALPPMRHAIRVDCTTDALEIYDPVGHKFPLGWNDIMLVAAGKVAVTEFKRVSMPMSLPADQGRALGIVDELLFSNTNFPNVSRASVTQGEPLHYESREEHHQRWMVEVVIRGGGLRYNFEAEQALAPLFLYLGDRRTDDVTTNFKLLVQDICRGATQAAVNRGAYYLREGNVNAFAYETKNAFYDEMTWLLWKLSADGQAAGEPE